VYGDRVFVPVASWEETRSLDPAYPCCTFRGSIAALRVNDGVPVWQTYLVPEAKRTGANKRGTPQFGPSGAGVWSAPTIDQKRGLMYIGTGDNYSRRQLLVAGIAAERCDRRARPQVRPRRVVEANASRRCV
jgi:polyvinyl alcohol dehydrogenase (cytochrome)